MRTAEQARLGAIAATVRLREEVNDILAHIEGLEAPSQPTGDNPLACALEELTASLASLRNSAVVVSDHAHRLVELYDGKRPRPSSAGHELGKPAEGGRIGEGRMRRTGVGGILGDAREPQDIEAGGLR